MTESLRLQTLALIGQEFLAQALVNGGSLDSTLADMLLTAKPASGREKTAVALTGRIRGDAAALRQGARNAEEGAAMADMLKNATHSLGETLSEMQTLVQSVAGGQVDAATAQTAFDDLAARVSATVSGTQYNGISLLDKSGWTSDRLALSENGDTATISIQLGDSAASFTLRDLSALKGLQGTKLEYLHAQDPDLGELTQAISTHVGTVAAMGSGYGALARSYASEAVYLEKQADVLTRAAARAVAGAAQAAGTLPETDPDALRNTLLMDMVLRDQGALVDTSS